jgi:hypothetical protein
MELAVIALMSDLDPEMTGSRINRILGTANQPMGDEAITLGNVVSAIKLVVD